MSDAQSIVAMFDALPDCRRGQGQRHHKTLILLITLMATMSGYHGYRAIGDFITRNREALLMHFKPHKDRLPTFDTVRRLLLELDFDQLSQAFSKWAIGRTTIRKGEWMSVDGKALAGTMSAYHKAHQRFINLVSIYCSRTGLVLAAAQVDNSKQSEIPVVQQLIAALDLKGVTFSPDALHCQKKRLPQSGKAVISMS